MSTKAIKGREIDVEATLEAVRTIERNRTGIVLTGRVKNGKVVLDQSSLDAIARDFADADLAFVAVNAPFDPKPCTTTAGAESIVLA